MKNSVKALLLGGAIQLSLGFYFFLVRPPLLREDIRYIGTSLLQIQTSVPGLAVWLRRVFWVMGGHMFATGTLTCYLAVTGFQTRARGVAFAVFIAGAASTGWMTVVNFMIRSDFKWLLFSFTATWVVALSLYWVEGRHKACFS